MERKHQKLGNFSISNLEGYLVVLFPRLHGVDVDTNVREASEILFRHFYISVDYFNIIEEASQFKFMLQELRPGAYCALLGRSVPSFQSLRPTQHICKHHDS